MWLKYSEIFFFILLTLRTASYVETAKCSRFPANTMTSKSPVDENFVLSITGNAQYYILGQSYNISLQSYNGRRFMGASVVLENSVGDRVYTDNLGKLEIVDATETRYSQNCSNMIETTNMNYKTRVDMVWTAPTVPGMGCVLIRATVLQHRDVWFMDDGALTKQVCEETVDEVQSQLRDDKSTPCCACDEARYEVTLEATWSRNLHPKDFPTKGWLTRFSDIIGAAHSSDYRFWDNGAMAIPEMQEFAEHASTKGLERELNLAFKEDKVRTILKARGPVFPYMNVPSVASMRVDPWHHQFSIASKIVPSPDWIIGVPGLELCNKNCTWLEQAKINLYPWDIGTDAGPTYTSPDQPQVPPDVIRRMSSQFPADIRSPFFDETGIPMKPIAVLTIKRQRLYDRKCPDEESNNPIELPRECHTHPWTDWSRCSANCGQGDQYRDRAFKQPDLAIMYNCGAMVESRQMRPCMGSCTNDDSETVPSIDGDSLQYGNMDRIKSRRISAADCRLGDWGDWMPCNATCGAGFRIRQRELLDRNADEECRTIEERFEYIPCFNRKCSSGRRNPIPPVGSNQGLDDYRNYDVNQRPDERDRYNTRYNSAYNRDDDRRDGRGQSRDPSDYNTDNRSQQYAGKDFRNQQRERINPYDTTDIDDSMPYGSYTYGQDRDGDDGGYNGQQRSRSRNRQYDNRDNDVNGDSYDYNQRPAFRNDNDYNRPASNSRDDYDYNRQQSNSRNDYDYNRQQSNSRNDYDNNRQQSSSRNDYDYNAQQNNRLNRRPSYGQDNDGDNDVYNRRRYNSPNNDRDDPLLGYGDPYNFPAESLKQDLNKTSTPFPPLTRSKGDFQYLNSPVKDTEANDAENVPEIAIQKIDPMRTNEQSQQINNNAELTKAPVFCYQPLTIAECSDAQTIGNFWFYNHCTDECMLYAADICDHNMNRFTSMEQCEEQCANPARSNQAFLLDQQKAAAHCQTDRSKRQWKR